MRQRTRSTTATFVAPTLLGVALALCVLTPASGFAQQHGTGNGFLFGTPDGSFTFRGGYSLANASGDLFALQKKQFTIGPRGFDALSLGFDMNVSATRRVDVGVTIDGTVRSNTSEYRGFEDNNNQPIEQTTKLSTVGFSANVRYNLRDRGRTISKFAWIPSQVVPYVGAGGGLLDYEFKQKGDFIDFTTNNVSPDELTSSAWTGMAQLFSGVTYAIGPRFTLVSEARYTMATAKMTDDYTDFGHINLSGLSINFGTSVRF